MASDNRHNQDSQCALIVQQQGKPQHVLVRYLTLLLNYRYGLDIIVVHRLVEAFATVQKHRQHIRCAFVVQNRSIDSRSSIATLGEEGSIPVFLLLPGSLIKEHRTLCHRLQNIQFCSWEKAFSHTGSSLHKVIAAAFAELDIGDLFAETAALSPEESEQRIQHRVEKLKTLPTVPELALRIMNMVEDPNTTVEELEEVVMRDPAVVHKLIQVVNTTVFAGATHRESWPLQEAIVRLGRKKVGAIALQIKLMNSLVRPQESRFDLGRFWRHSVACALIADKLVTGEHITLPETISFDKYWIAALLHDIGKLVLGFFFWNHFEDVLKKMEVERIAFRQSELTLGDFANHEFLGKLMLMRSKVDGDLAAAVGSHHVLEDSPRPLVWLVHLADNLSKEIDLAYMPGAPPDYSPAVLESLRLDQQTVSELAESLGEPVATEVEELVERCLHG